MTMGERIRYYRKLKGLTQNDVAIEVGLKPAAISKYEKNLREPKPKVLRIMADLFETTVDNIVGR